MEETDSPIQPRACMHTALNVGLEMANKNPEEIFRLDVRLPPTT
jgi:hypothetical protein